MPSPNISRTVTFALTPEDSIVADVLPSIIVLAITALLVFRRDLTIPRAKKVAPRAAAKPSKAREASR
jgi:hypothetical protein